MRGFVITCSLFLATLICIFINFNLVNSIHDTMHEAVAHLSDEPCEANAIVIEELKKYWEDKNAYLSISVSFREIDDLTNAIDALYAANSTGDKTQFGIYKELTQNAIDAIMRLEKISIKNIF